MPEAEILKYESVIRSAVVAQHRAALSEPVPVPGPTGAFPSTRLPWTFPLVLDTHALGADLARHSRVGRTVLVSGAISGVLRLFAPRHVAAEVREYMAVWAKLAERPIGEVGELWERVYLPLLRVVRVPGGPLYPDELARVRILATDGHPHGDPDDVPTAILGLLLDAPVLSHDEDLLRAVYGADYDFKAHGQWLEALRAGGDLGPFGGFINAGYLLTASAAVGTCGLIAKAAETLGWPLTLLIAGAGAASFYFFASPEAKAKIAGVVKAAALEGWELLQALGVTYAQARMEVEAMAPGSPPFREGYDPDGVLLRVCLHAVARSRGPVSAEQLSEQLALLDIPHGEKKVREVLRSTTAFDEVSKGRFQLGHALVREAAATATARGAA